jgi:hypothetical protein
MIGTFYAPGGKRCAENSSYETKAMTHGGKRDGAGRRSGTPNRASARREQYVAQSGATPLDGMLRIFRYYLEIAEYELKQKNPNKNVVKFAFTLALEAATKAAPFVHPRVAQMDLTSQYDPGKLNKDELTTLVTLLAKATGHGPDTRTLEHSSGVT